MGFHYILNPPRMYENIRVPPPPLLERLSSAATGTNGCQLYHKIPDCCHLPVVVIVACNYSGQDK